MKILHIVLRIILGLLVVTPILGALGIFPAPTADLYKSTEAFAFINALFMSGYIIQLMAVVFAISLVLIATNRMALASILIFPITVNIVSFHLFLDGGLFTMSALMGNILLVLNLYFLWQNRMQYKILLNKSTPQQM